MKFGSLLRKAAPRVIINGRCLCGVGSGVQRFASGFLASDFGIESKKVIMPPKFAAHGLMGHLWEQIILPLYIRRNDLLFSPGNTGPILIRKQILVIHDLATFDVPQFFTSIFSTWYRFLTRILVWRSAKIIVVSEFSKDRVMHYFPRANSKCFVIHNGVYVKDICYSDRFRFRNGANENQRLVFLFVGSLDPRKNLSNLLRAWSAINRRMGAELMIVGGSYRAVFKETKIDAALTKGVQILGRVDENKLKECYLKADVVVIPSFYEGFGYPLLEALAYGVPNLIVSNIPPFREILGGNAEYINPNSVDELTNAINKVAMGRAPRIGDRERDRLLKKFSLEASIKKYKKIILEMAYYG